MTMLQNGVPTFRFCMDRHSSTILCVPNVFSVTAVRRVSLNLTVAAEWKTIVTSEHSLCLSSALRPRSGSDTSPLMHTTLLNTFSASTSDRIRSNTCETRTGKHQINIRNGHNTILFIAIISLYGRLSAVVISGVEFNKKC